MTTRSIEPTIDLPSPKMHPDTPPTTFESIIRVPTLRAISIDINEDKINETRNKQIGFLTRHLSAKSIDTRDFEIPKDEEGVIVFDRSAAPVFVDREKPVIQRLISKRFQTHVASIDIDELLDSLTDEQRTLYASLPVDERGNFLSSLTVSFIGFYCS